MTHHRYRTAPAHRFNGGYAGHGGKIQPLERPSLIRRIFKCSASGGHRD